MEFYNIIKDGISNTVDAGQYEAIYKPAGWKTVDEKKTEQIKITKPEDETVLNNTNKMRRKSGTKKFDDKLIKGE